MLTAGLLAYAIAGGSVGVRVLRRAHWLTATPRAGALAWLVLSASVPAALLGASLSALAATAAGHSVADLLHACLLAFRSALSGSLTPAWATLLGVGLVGVALRTPVLFVVEVRRGYRIRKAQRAGLQLVGVRCLPQKELLVVRHPVPVAFCLPGRTRTIVITSAAVASLAPDELAAVLAHERAHLRGRHHLALAWTGAVARSLPILPDLRQIGAEQGRLMEMAADDQAARVSSPRTVARAIVRLVGQPPGGAGLGAADLAVAGRVERLTTPRLSTRRSRTSGLLLALTLLASIPVALATVVGLAAASVAHCPVA